MKENKGGGRERRNYTQPTGFVADRVVVVVNKEGKRYLKYGEKL